MGQPARAHDAESTAGELRTTGAAEPARARTEAGTIRVAKAAALRANRARWDALAMATTPATTGSPAAMGSVSSAAPARLGARVKPTGAARVDWRACSTSVSRSRAAAGERRDPGGARPAAGESRAPAGSPATRAVGARVLLRRAALRDHRAAPLGARAAVPAQRPAGAAAAPVAAAPAAPPARVGPWPPALLARA